MAAKGEEGRRSRSPPRDFSDDGWGASLTAPAAVEDEERQDILIGTGETGLEAAFERLFSDPPSNKPPPSIYYKGFSRRRIRCGSCFQIGHFSPDCPDKTFKYCYLCEVSGHNARKCPKNQFSERGDGLQTSVRNSESAENRTTSSKSDELATANRTRRESTSSHKNYFVPDTSSVRKDDDVTAITIGGFDGSPGDFSNFDKFYRDGHLERACEFSDDGWDSEPAQLVHVVSELKHPDHHLRLKKDNRSSAADGVDKRRTRRAIDRLRHPLNEGFRLPFNSEGLKMQGNNNNNNYGSIPCYCCDELGHIGRNCPKYAASGSMSRSFHRCLVCKRYSHNASNCPVLIREARGCFNCGEKGHVSLKCSMPYLPIKCRFCDNCRRRGHLDVACIRPLKEPEPCDNCGEIDHETSVCPEHAGVEQGPLFDRLLDATVTVNDGGDEQAIALPWASFKDMNLVHLVNLNIFRLGFVVPTPIQQNAVPIIQDGKDLLASACSGSSKSAAFILPIISKLVEENDNDAGGCRDRGNTHRPCLPRCLVITPTRELARQIYEDAEKIAKNTELTTGVVYGGIPMSQHRELFDGAAVLVATPGRLLHLIEEFVVSLEKLRFFVLDEADRMIDENFQRQINNIFKEIPNKGNVQTLMFSMTFANATRKMADFYLKEGYTEIVVDARGAANKCIEQKIISCRYGEKMNKLMQSLNMHLDIKVRNGLTGGDIVAATECDKTIIFVERKCTARYLYDRFKFYNGVHIFTSIHSNLGQSERTQNLHNFKEAKRGILIATGVAERGLELKHIDHVINYDLPRNIDTYVHRIGRCGRRGNAGRTTSFYNSFNDRHLAKDLVECMKNAGKIVESWLEIEATL